MQKVDNFSSAADILRRGTQHQCLHISLQKSYIMPYFILNMYFRGSLIILLMFGLGQMLYSQHYAYDDIENKLAFTSLESTMGGVIQIKGQIIEQASRKPFELAIIIVKCGDQIVASKHSAKDGSFLLTIPLEKVQERTFELKIKYLNHIFIHENIKLAPQKIIIEINGQIFHENGLLDAYNLPVHTLGTPKVGTVTSTLFRPKPTIQPSKI